MAKRQNGRFNRRLTLHVRFDPDPRRAKKPWVADYYDQKGKRHQPHFAFKHKAREFLVKALGEVKTGSHTPARDSKTFTEMAELYFEYLAVVDNRERGTVNTYRCQFGKHIAPVLGNMRISEFTLELAADFQIELARETNFATAKAAWGLLRRIVGEAIRRGQIGINVVAQVGKIKRSSRHDKEKFVIGRDVPSAEEATKVLTHIVQTHDPREKAMHGMLLLTGIRSSELRGLTWPNIDFDTGIVSIRQRADRYNEIGSTKSVASRRDLHLPPFVLNALEEYRPLCPRHGGTIIGTTPEKAQAIARWLVTYPDMPHRHLARILHVDRQIIRQIRTLLQLPEPRITVDPDIPELPVDAPVPDLTAYYSADRDRGYAIAPAKVSEIARYLTAFPDIKNAYIAEHFRCSVAGVGLLRKTLGLHPSRKNNFKLFEIPPEPPETLRVILPEFRDGKEWLVFPNKQGEVLAYEVFMGELARVQVAAGVTKEGGAKYAGGAKYTGHRFRHFFASALANAGLPPIRLKEFMGHARISTTMDLYAHFMPNKEKDGAAVAELAEKILPLR